VPEYYRCKNPKCTRTSALLVANYRADIPPDTPPDRIHEVVESGVHEFAIMCTCGHYTRVKPWRDASPTT